MGATNFLMFSLLNVIGILLLAGPSLSDEQAFLAGFWQFNFLIFSAVAISIGLGLVLKAGNDSSFGEILRCIRAGICSVCRVALWRVGQFFDKRFHLPLWRGFLLRRRACLLDFYIGSAAAVALTLLHASCVSKSKLRSAAFVYLREHTPPNSVILTNRYWNGYNFVVSSLTDEPRIWRRMETTPLRSWRSD